MVSNFPIFRHFQMMKLVTKSWGWNKKLQEHKPLYMYLFRCIYWSLTFSSFQASLHKQKSNSYPLPPCQENWNCVMSGLGLLFCSFFLPSILDVIIKLNHNNIIICALSLSTSLLSSSFLMQHNLEWLQRYFVSLHSHLKLQVKSREPDLLRIYPMGKYWREGFLLPGSLQTFW